MCFIGLFLISLIGAGSATEKEVTGKVCGKYLTLNSNNQNYDIVNMVWYNRNWDCKCPVGKKIPIWFSDEGQTKIGFTCKK